MALLRPKGRIALCGAISRYNENVEYEAGTGPNTIMTTQMLYTHQRIEGFVCSPWLSGQKGEHGRLQTTALAGLRLSHPGAVSQGTFSRTCTCGCEMGSWL